MNDSLKLAKQYIDVTGRSMLLGQRPLALILSAQQRFPKAEVVTDAVARVETVFADEEKVKAIAFQEIDKGI
ncbi:hypothetical protein Tco_1538992 [Tanacetum coccineum]